MDGKKRIINLEEATEFSNSDYLVVDSQESGTRKIKESLFTDAIGAPLVASVVADMTDTSRVYVYTGSETGYTNGNWYYWNGSAWVSGGVYNAVAVVTDTTLSISGKPADAKATGDEITNLKSNLTVVDDFLRVNQSLPMKELHGVRTVSSGTKLQYYNESTTGAGYHTAKIKVKPNTAYSIVQNGSTFISALTTSENISLDDIAATNPYSPANCTIVAQINITGTTYYNFVTDANAEYLYICYTITGESVALAVYEETVSDFITPNVYTKAQTDTEINEVKAAVGMNQNIWDGTVLHGVKTVSSGTKLQYYNEATSGAGYYTAKVKISPNTAYSIIRSESSFLGAITSSQNIVSSDFNTTNPITPANENVIAIVASATPTFVNFTSDANAEYLYINYTQTGESTKLAVYEGTYSDFQDTFFYTKEQIDAMVSSFDQSVGEISGSGGSVFVTINNAKYEVRHIENSSIRADLWRIYAAYIKVGTTYVKLWDGQDADGVVKIYGESDFIGGFHGDEVLTVFKLFVDGVEQSSTTFNGKQFREIVLYQESDIYHCNENASADTVAFKRCKALIFNKNGLTIKNHWTAQGSINVIRAFFGMLTVLKYQTDGTTVLCNGFSTDADYAYETADTTTELSPDMKEVIMHTAFGDVSISMSKNTETNYRGYVQYYNAAPIRTKTYLGPINNDSGIVLSSGDVLRGEALIQVRM